ncbi:MAG: hypothetical protein PF692_07680 [Kiritimatiellae bacterium]|jgi:hypothetical protein|nr:hypothetical protein [Kiritimatiellia bacterium]
MSENIPIFEITMDLESPPFKYCREKCMQGRITIGEFSERLYIPISVWKPGDYFKQWKEGLRRVLNSELDSCLVVAMRKVRWTSDNLEIWPIYNDSEHVFIHNQILFNKDIRKKFVKHDIYYFINERETIDEEGNKISEWKIPIESVKVFYDKLCSGIYDFQVDPEKM